MAPRADDIHPLSLFTHPGRIRSRESLQPTPVRPCSGSTEQWKRVKERGSVWPGVKSVRSSQYAPVTGSTGSLINFFQDVIRIFSGHFFVLLSNAPSFCTQQLPAFPPAGFPVCPVSPDSPSFSQQSCWRQKIAGYRYSSRGSFSAMAGTPAGYPDR